MTKIKICLTVLLLVAALSAVSAPSREPAFQFPMVQSGKCLIELQQPLSSPPVISSNGAVTVGIAEIDNALADLQAYNIKPLSQHYAPESYIVYFNSEQSVESAVTALKALASLKEAYPCPLVKTSELRLNPNDFLYPSQWHHETMHSPQGWAVYQGSTSVQVGVIDGGVDYTHPDLAPNVWVNPGEDLNGNGIIDWTDWNFADDDGNGYIDDFYGYDWVDVAPLSVWPGEDPGPPDNDPMDFGGHGTHCAGDACAASNNLEGVASPGFNSQIMCLRAGYTEAGTGQGLVMLDAAISAAYYAIDNGGEALTMSFGGSGMWIPFRTAMEIAADSGLILLAAAGNDNNSQISYPAGYDDVIAVAATTIGDIKADFSNFGTWITVSAPGDQIYSTIPGGYGNMSGTSMATPVCAGVAALVKALQPEWSSIEVGEWLAETADNIDAVNPSYIGLLGGGRVNTYKAVDMFVSIDSVYVDYPVDYSDRILFNTQCALVLRLHKAVGSASNVNVSLSSDNPRVNFTSNFYYIGSIAEGQPVLTDPLPLTVSSGGEDYELIDFQASISGDGFEYTQSFQVPAGIADVLILDADANNGQRTASFYETALQQMGYSYETHDISELSAISDYSMNFTSVIVFSGTAENNILSAENWADLQTYMYAYDGHLIISGQNIAQDLSVNNPSILQSFLFCTYNAPHSNDLTIDGNPSYAPAADMYLVLAGTGGAWNQNSCDVITPNTLMNQTTFVYNTSQPTNAAGFYRAAGGGEMFFCAFGLESVNDSASSGNTKQEVLQMMFDVFGVSGVEDNNPAKAPLTFELEAPYPNPFNSSTAISFNLNRPGEVSLKIYDITGREVQSLVTGHSSLGKNTVVWDAEGCGSGVYFIRLSVVGGQSVVRKVVLMK